MILTDDKNLYELCVSLRAHGWIKTYPMIIVLKRKLVTLFTIHLILSPPAIALGH